MSSPDSICTQERRLSPIQLWLPEAKCRIQPWLLLPPSHRQTSRRHRRSKSFFNAGPLLGLLADINRRAKSRRDRAHIPPYPVKVHQDVVWAKNNPSRAMNVIPASVRWQLALLSLDNNISFSKSPQSYTKQIRRVLPLHYETRVTDKLKKFGFFAETIDYVGHVIRPDHSSQAEHTTDPVARAPLQKDVIALHVEIEQFLKAVSTKLRASCRTTQQQSEKWST